MRSILTILAIIFCLQSWTKADDISNLQIEGMSVGESLLDYFTKVEIDKIKSTPWKDKKTFYQFHSNKNLSKYEFITAAYLINDNNYKIHELSGRSEMNYKECKKEILNISSQIENLFNSAIKDDKGEYNHRADKSKKSKVRTINYSLSNGSLVHVACYNWSNDMTKKKGWKDKLIIALASKQYVEWQKNKAYK